ncbi:MAG: succinate dehydrogenase/fumarate reductase iron-sulfur subunit [Spirochaetaceae bacterium]|nr:MAG: succinate dehydrogenase/fumarate reductase iron-sulfur subunit [Spirochaetaceae bacterium]
MSEPMSEQTTNRTFRVYRSAGGEARKKPPFESPPEMNLVEYSVPVTNCRTVLDALEYIRSHIDETISYRHSCHHGSCGTCGVVVNGESRLACLARTAEFAEPITVTPMMFPVHRDLVSRMQAFHSSLPRDFGYLRPSELNVDAPRPSEVSEFSRFEDCIECGLCVSVCPVSSTFIGPAALAMYNRELEKSPRRRDELLDAVSSSDGVAACERALNCSRVCPTGVYPARHIAELKRALEQRDTGPRGSPVRR